MADRTLPGFGPRFVSYTLTCERSGWCARILYSDEPRYVMGAEARTYEGLTWAEAVQLLADELDAVNTDLW